jgi:hypothetical protein
MDSISIAQSPQASTNEGLSTFPSLIDPSAVLDAVGDNYVSEFGLTDEGISMLVREMVARNNVAQIAVVRRPVRRRKTRVAVVAQKVAVAV